MSHLVSQPRTNWHRFMPRQPDQNGGEGGIRTPGTLSGTTDFESVTFGHSATSPKSEVRKSSRRALARTEWEDALFESKYKLIAPAMNTDTIALTFLHHNDLDRITT